MDGNSCINTRPVGCGICFKPGNLTLFNDELQHVAYCLQCYKCKGILTDDDSYTINARTDPKTRQSWVIVYLRVNIGPSLKN